MKNRWLKKNTIRQAILDYCAQNGLTDISEYQLSLLEYYIRHGYVPDYIPASLMYTVNNNPSGSVPVPA